MNRKPAFAFLVVLLAAGAVFAHQAARKTGTGAKSAPEEKPDYSQEAFVIEKYHITARFNEDGTGTRELLFRARVQTEGGVQQLGQLALGYNSANEKLEVDYVRVHKPDGPVVEAGPNSVQDLSAPIEREAPVYTDFRQKHITVPGLRPGDTFEYKVTTHIHTPLAPGHFWLEHEFIEQVIVLDEALTVVVPGTRKPRIKTRPEFKTVQMESGRATAYTWTHQNLKRDEPEEQEKRPRRPRRRRPELPAVQLTTFQSWEEIGQWYAGLERDRVAPDDAIRAKAAELINGKTDDAEKVEALYGFVARNFRYVSLSFGLGRYQPHSAAEVFANQYGDCKDKHTLLASLLNAAGFEAYPVLINSSRKIDPEMPSPSQFDHVITAVHTAQGLSWMDTTSEVAPFRMLSANLRKKQALLAPREGSPDGAPRLLETPADPPFASSHLVEIEGTVSELGKLDANVRYTLRGDNELPLRITFRRTPKNQWKQLGQMISSGDGVGGQVLDIKAGDPADTKQPFTVEFQVSQANFLDWAKKRLQVSLPVPGMGLPPADEDPEDDTEPLELGSPLDVTMRLKLEFPAKYQLRAPIPVAITRDYAEYRSSYKLEGQNLVVERGMRFRLREIPAARSRDYLAFARAVRADEAQSINLESTVAGAPAIPGSAKPGELYLAALAGLRNENPAQAVELLKRVAELEPQHKQVWNTLGFAYFSAQDFELAVIAFQKQIALNPYDENAYRNLGLVYQRQQKFAESVEALKKQLEVKPLDKAAQSLLGVVYREWRKYEEAAAELEKAISLDPENAALHVNLGQSYLNLKQNDKAIQAFDKAVELEPSPTVWNNVAYELSVNRVHLERARQYAESAVAATAAELRNVELSRVTMNDMRKISALASYWDTLGWIHFQNGDLDKAEKYVRAAWLLDFHGEVGDHLGQIREKRGDKDGAIRYYVFAWRGTRPVAESLERLAALAGAGGVAGAIQKHGKEFVDLGLFRLGPIVKEFVTADFLMTFVPDAQGQASIAEVRFLKGDEKLRSLLPTLRTLKYDVAFPNENPVKIIRRGGITCSAVKPECLFLVLAADKVTSVD